MNKIVLLALLSIANFVFAQNKTIYPTKSIIMWEGKKVTGKHEGTINLSSGTLVFKKDKLKGGEMVVDMTTINTTDLTGGKKDDLDKHLKNDDFFGVDKHPTAKLVFTKIKSLKNNAYKITADLTIKGITKPVTFDLKVDNANTAIANVVIDRTLYDIKYGSGSFFDNLGDKAIDNNFTLSVKLVY